MAQKKVPPTPQQHSSSSDDEEEEVEATTPSEQADSSSDDEETSGEDEEDVTPLAPVNKPTPPVEQHSSSSDDSEEEEEEEPNVTPVAPVKPVVVRRANSTQQPDLAPATAPASAVTVDKKRPAEESKAVSKKFKKKRVVKEVIKKVGDYPKTPTFQRVFTEDDEIAMLKALLNYSAEKCIHPIDSNDFHDFVKKSIHFDVTKDQLSRKIRSMKSKYKNNASKKKQTFGKAHDQSCYDISKKIWGKSSSSASGGSELETKRKEKRIPKMKNMTPGLQIPQVVEEPVPENISWSELAKTRDVVGMMCVSDDSFKKNLELLSNDEARAALEDKLKNIVTAEVELTYKRLELSRELMKASLDGHRG